MLRGTRRLVLRIVLASVLFSMVGLAIGGAIASTLMSNFLVLNAQNLNLPQVRKVIAACRQGAPPTEPVRLRGVTVELFNAADFSATTEGAIFRESFKPRIAAGKRRGVRVAWPLGIGTQGYQLRAQNGPCSLVQLTVVATPLQRPAVLNAFMWLGLFAVITSAAGAYLIAARPLLRRVAQTATAAETVGSDDFANTTASFALKDWDDLEAILGNLKRADSRIKKDAQLLKVRADEIEALLGSVAHDLKTPLATMQLQLQRALQSAENQDTTEGLRNSLAEVQYAASLLENLETTARLRNDMMPLARNTIDLRHLIEPSVTRFSLLGMHQSIEVNTDLPETPAWVSTDEILFTRILNNVLHNAVRHGTQGGHVAVVLTQSEGAFHLTISDDGPGFPDAVLARIDTKSLPQIAPSRIVGGGIGLPIVLQLCDRLDLSIDLANAPAGGAVVTLTGPTTLPPNDPVPGSA